MIWDLWASHGYAFMLVLFRTAGLVAVCPILGTRMVPARVRLAIAIAVAQVAYLGGGAPTVAMPMTFGPLLGQSLGETLMGLSAGLGAKMTLDAALAAGQTAALTMGLGYSSILDPLMGAESTVLGTLFTQAVLGFAVALGLHREALLWLAQSVHSIPPGHGVELIPLFLSIVTSALHAIALAVRVAFPFCAAVLMGHLSLAAMGRVAPQLNLQSVGFSVAILAGGAAIYIWLPAAADQLARAALASFSPTG